MPSGEPENSRTYFLRSVKSTTKDKATEEEREEIVIVPEIPVMAALLADIQKFNGEGPITAENWWDRYTRWCVFNGINGGRAANGVALYLTGPAAHWYESLAADIKNDFDKLEEAFKAHFKKDSAETDIFNIIQNLDESATAYLSRFGSRIRQTKLEDKHVVALGVKGLRPDVQRLVIQKEPKNMDELMHAARVAERANKVETNQTQKNISDTDIDRIVQQVAAVLTTANINAAQPIQQQEPYRRPENPPMKREGRGQQTCYGCGECCFLSRHNCPARGKTCSFCSKPNHFKRVCRAFKAKQTNPNGRA